MSEKELTLMLERENEKLRRDNEMLKKIIDQMRVTLNRLIIQYVTNPTGKE